jgi:hypothetical protein
LLDLRLRDVLINVQTFALSGETSPKSSGCRLPGPHLYSTHD